MPLTKRQIEAHCRDRLQKGESYESVRAFAIDQGLDSAVTTEIINQEIRVLRKKALRLIGWGAFAIVLSIGIGAVTLVSTQGMFVFLWWGPALVGLIVLLVGVPQFLRLPRLQSSNGSTDKA